MAAGLGGLFADAFPEVPTLEEIEVGFTFSKKDAACLAASLDVPAVPLVEAVASSGLKAAVINDILALIGTAYATFLSGLGDTLPVAARSPTENTALFHTPAPLSVTQVAVTSGAAASPPVAAFAHGGPFCLSGRVEASDWLWPADSCPDLLHAVAFWLRLRSLMRALPGACALMWRLPWEPAGFSTSRLRTVFANTLGSLNRCPPPGRKWSLHCIRAGPASECNALGIPLSRIRRQGGWGPKSDVPSKKYIDPSCPPSLDGRRFFDWLTPDGHLRRLGAA